MASKHFLTNSRKFITNMKVEDKIMKIEIMTLDEVLEDMNPYNLDKWTAAARRARAGKHVEEPAKKALYEGILVELSEVNSQFKELEVAQLVVNRIKDKRMRDINDCLWDDCTDAKETGGWTWDPKHEGVPGYDDGQVGQHTGTPEPLGVARGRYRCGQDPGKTYCIRYGLPLDCYAKALDPIGSLTRSGTTE